MKKLIYLSIYFTTFYSSKVQAATKYFELSINGNYYNAYSSTYIYKKYSYGLELSIPVGRYFEYSFGYNYSVNQYIYNDTYRQYLTVNDVKLPAGSLTQKEVTQDYFTNIGIGFYKFHIAPSIFAGLLKRNTCLKDIYNGKDCSKNGLSWNAGSSISFYIVEPLRLKLTYRISPSGYHSKYDEEYTAGMGIAF